MFHLKTILHPTDFSEDSRHALEVACALARDQASRLILLHALPRSAPIGRDTRVPAFKDAHTDEDLQAYRQEAMARLEKLREDSPYSDVHLMVREGPAPEVIIRTAEETPCELIVIGTHGMSRTYRKMMGSVAAEVTKRAPCPVVSVRTPVAAAAAATEAGQAAGSR